MYDMPGFLHLRCCYRFSFSPMFSVFPPNPLFMYWVSFYFKDCCYAQGGAQMELLGKGKGTKRGTVGRKSNISLYMNPCSFSPSFVDGMTLMMVFSPYHWCCHHSIILNERVLSYDSLWRYPKKQIFQAHPFHPLQTLRFLFPPSFRCFLSPSHSMILYEAELAFVSSIWSYPMADPILDTDWPFHLHAACSMQLRRLSGKDSHRFSFCWKGPQVTQGTLMSMFVFFCFLFSFLYYTLVDLRCPVDE